MRPTALIRWFLVACAATLVLPASAVPSVAAVPPAASPLPRAPLGFSVQPYAHVGGAGTSLAFGPDTRTGQNGTRLYATDFVGNQVVAIDDAGGVGSRPAVFATGFSGPLGVTTDRAGNVYVADHAPDANGPFGNRTYGRVWRLSDANHDGTIQASEKTLVIGGLPNGRHNTNGLAIGPDGSLYVANGNSTDDGVEGGDPEVKPWSGSVIRVDPAASNLSLGDIDRDHAKRVDTLVAQGMRNLYDLAFSPLDPTKLFIPMNGLDDARQGSSGAQTPADPVEDGDDVLFRTDVDDRQQVGVDAQGNPIFEPRIDDFGYPSCVYNYGTKGNLEPYDNPNAATIAKFGPCPKDSVPRPVASFGTHVSADGLAFQTTDAWGADFRNDLFVAEFGNNPGNAVKGHMVVRVELDPTGERVVRESEFLSGVGPLDLTFDAAGAMYVLDFTGAIYKVTKAADVPNHVNIDINAFTYDPPVVTVPEGTIVTWTNNDTLGLPHTVTSQLVVDPATGSYWGGTDQLDSPALGKGQSYTVRMDYVATYEYICTIHPAEMHAIISVVPAGS